MGIEPTYAAWEAAVLPLNYTRDGRGLSMASHSLKLKSNQDVLIFSDRRKFLEKATR